MFKKLAAATIVAMMSTAVLAQGATAAPSAAKPVAQEQKADAAKPADTAKAGAPMKASPVAKHRRHHKHHQGAKVAPAAAPATPTAPAK